MTTAVGARAGRTGHRRAPDPGRGRARHHAHAGRVHRAAGHPQRHRGQPGRRHRGPDLDPELDEHRPGRRAAVHRDDRRRLRPPAQPSSPALLVLALASFLAALAPQTLVFVLARVLQGVGGAAVIAASLGLIAHAFPPGPARAAASGVWGAAVGRRHRGRSVGRGRVRAAGRLARHLLAARRGRCWRSPWPPGRWSGSPGRTGRAGWTCRACVTLARRDERAAGGAGRGTAGLDPPDGACVLAVVAVLALVLFVLVEARVAAPMLELSLLRQPAFAAATGAAFATGAGVLGLMPFMSGFLGAALGITALRAGACCCSPGRRPACSVRCWPAGSRPGSRGGRSWPSACSGWPPGSSPSAGSAPELDLAALRARAAGGRGGQRDPERRARPGGRGQRAARSRRDGQRGQQHRPLRRLRDRGDRGRGDGRRRTGWPDRRLEPGHGGDRGRSPSLGALLGARPPLGSDPAHVGAGCGWRSRSGRWRPWPAPGRGSPGRGRARGRTRSAAGRSGTPRPSRAAARCSCAGPGPGTRR